MEHVACQCNDDVRLAEGDLQRGAAGCSNRAARQRSRHSTTVSCHSKQLPTSYVYRESMQCCCTSSDEVACVLAINRRTAVITVICCVGMGHSDLTKHRGLMARCIAGYAGHNCMLLTGHSVCRPGWRCC
jgi:hypothetical protein